MSGPASADCRRLETNDAVVAAAVGEQTVLLHVDTGVYFQLDQVGARIWSLLAEGRDIGAIVSRLSDEYDVGIGELRRDVEAFLEQLLARDLLQPAQ